MQEGERGAQSGGEAPELEEEARVGVPGRLWLVGSGSMTCWGGVGWARLIAQRTTGRVGEQWSRHNALTQELSHAHTPTPAGTHTQNPRWGGPCRHPSRDCGASLPGRAPGPHSTQACKLGKFPKGSGPCFLYLGNGDNNSRPEAPTLAGEHTFCQALLSAFCI